MKEPRILIIVGILLVIATFGYAVGQKLPTETWTTPHHGPFPVLTPQVVPGGILRWSGELCRVSDDQYVIDRVIRHVETGREIHIDRVNSGSRLEKGECANQVREVLVPAHATPGKSIEISRFTSFRGGEPFKTVEFRTEEFEVLSETEPLQ